MGWIDSQLANINWRLCLIFLPAILNGQWANLGFYSPFIFSYVLSSCRAELFRLTSEGFFSNKGKTLYVLAQIVGFTLFVQYFESEGKYLSSFFFSSFLCPAIRHYSPSHGDQIVYGIVTLALTGAYIFQGLGPFFFGLFFLQGVPEIQRHLWFEPTKNFCLIGSVFLLTAPFTSLGTVAYWKQDWLPLFPVTYLKWLCLISNVAVVDYHSILGVSYDATPQQISSHYRRLALQLHPDKIPASVSAAERAAMSEKFTKIAEAHDMLNRPRNEGVAELQELVPRGTAAAFLCLYWVMHMLMDFMEIEQTRIKNGDNLRKHLRQKAPDGTPLSRLQVNFKAIGLEDRPEEFDRYLESDDLFDTMPLCRENNLDDVMEMREILKYAGIKVKALPKGGLPKDTPLILPLPPPQAQAPQKPGWMFWLEAPEQANNILAYSYKGDEKNLRAALKGIGMPQQPACAAITPGMKSCLYLAAMNGHAKCIELLVQHGGEVNHADDIGFSPLHMASVGGHQEAVSCLLHFKADPHQLAKNQLAPVHTAALSGSIPTMKRLLAAGAKIKGMRDQSGETPMFCAAKANRPEMLLLLAKQGGEIETANQEGVTPMWVAAAIGNVGAVAALHKLGASTEVRPQSVDGAVKDKTPCEAAEVCGKQDVVAAMNRLDALQRVVKEAQEEADEAKRQGKSKDDHKELLSVVVTHSKTLNDVYKEYIEAAQPSGKMIIG